MFYLCLLLWEAAKLVQLLEHDIKPIILEREENEVKRKCVQFYWSRNMANHYTAMKFIY